MDLRRRRLKLSDIEACVELVTRHPEFLTLYRSEREALSEVLKRLVSSLSFFGVVLEAVERDHVEIVGVGAVAFLTNDFVASAKRAPFFWLGPTIIQRMLEGESPVLSDPELLRANA